MVDSFKMKIVDVEKCNENILNNSLRDFGTMIESHNINYEMFVELIDKVVIDDIEEANEYYSRAKHIEDPHYYSLTIVLKNGDEIYTRCYEHNLFMKWHSNLDTYNLIHQLLNDDIEEKYYSPIWLKNTNKIVSMIEHSMYRPHGFPERISDKTVQKHNEVLKFIDNKLGELVEKLNLDVSKCKNKFIIKNTECFVNSKYETIINLKINDETLIVVFKYDRSNHEYGEVSYHWKEQGSKF